MSRCLAVAVVVVACLSAPLVATETMTLATWNIQSNDASKWRIGEEMADLHDVDLWGLCEVADEDWAKHLEEQLDQQEGRDFKRALGDSGGSLKLLVLYDNQVFSRIAQYEISWSERDWYIEGMRPRSPLVIQFEHRESGFEFLFVLVHLYRGDPEEQPDPRRLDQASVLASWASTQSLPVIVAGDFNFDWRLLADDDYDNYSRGYGNLTHGNVLTWVVPGNYSVTFCGTLQEGGLYVEDFFFIANASGLLSARSRVVTECTCKGSDGSYSDHRPVEAVFELLPRSLDVDEAADGG